LTGTAQWGVRIGGLIIILLTVLACMAIWKLTTGG
jgi:hypothetical protein